MPRIVENSFNLLGFTFLKGVDSHIGLGILLQLDSCCLNHVVEFVVQTLRSVPLERLKYVVTFEFMKPDHGTMWLVKRDQKFPLAAWLGKSNGLQLGVAEFHQFGRLNNVGPIARIQHRGARIRYFKRHVDWSLASLYDMGRSLVLIKINLHLDIVILESRVESFVWAYCGLVLKVVF